uniref:Uncharacterized protein n=1 Tax=Ixodes scapularis TaxID=6945 RepID=A0A4D5RX12_IXOSC
MLVCIALLWRFCMLSPLINPDNSLFLLYIFFVSQERSTVSGSLKCVADGYMRLYCLHFLEAAQVFWYDDAAISFLSCFCFFLKFAVVFFFFFLDVEVIHLRPCRNLEVVRDVMRKCHHVEYGRCAAFVPQL